jgi:N-glycosylase/DNA lyase
VPVLETREPVLLQASLRGGQSFRWRAEDDALVGVARGRRFRVEPHPDGVAYASDPPGARDVLSDYLDVGEGYVHAVEALAGDPLVAEAVEGYRGLRVLRQDPWEATAAFVLSSNNNVARIEGLVEALARKAGEARETPEGATWWTFPDPADVAALGEGRLRELGCGYRAPYLAETAGMVARGDVDLEALQGRSVAEAREALLTLHGVGDKVADCILVFGLGHGEAFPVDRWVARWIADRGPDLDPDDPGAVRAFARKRWGEEAGLAQQFLFHATRQEEGSGRGVGGTG